MHSCYEHKTILPGRTVCTRQHLFHSSPIITFSFAGKECLPATIVGIEALAALTFALGLARHAVALAGHVHGGGLALLLIVLGIEPHGLTLVQGLETVLGDGAEMDEDILTAVGRGDEAEALLGEEFDATLDGHLVVLGGVNRSRKYEYSLGEMIVC